jgi:hypothetical protein
MPPNGDNKATANDNKILAADVLNDDLMAPGDVVLADNAQNNDLMVLGEADNPASQPSAQIKSGFFDRGPSKRDLIWWVRKKELRQGGGLGNQGVGTIQLEAPPEFETGMTDNVPWARVKNGTGIVVVERSYTALIPGDQGKGQAGSYYPGKSVYLTPKLASHLDSHEQGHISASEKVYNKTLKEAVDMTTKYRETPLMGKAGESEELVRARLDESISWMNRRNQFKNMDSAVNEYVGKYHAWETAQGGGPCSDNVAGATIDGVKYDVVLRSRGEVEATYKIPVYQNFDPFAP